MTLDFVGKSGISLNSAIFLSPVNEVTSENMSLLGLIKKIKCKIVPCEEHLLDYISYLIMASVPKPYKQSHSRTVSIIAFKFHS